MYKEHINNATKSYPFLIEHDDVKYIPHFHQEIEVVYVLEGELLITLGNENHTIKKDDICIILPNSIHNLFTHTHSKTFVAKLYPVIDLNNIKLTQNIFNIDSPIYEELKECLSNIIKENKFKTDGYELAVNINASNLILMILRNIEHCKIDSRTKSLLLHEGDFLNQVDKFLDEHTSNDITLAEIAEKLNYTKSYFCRQFKKIAGVTFWEYYTMYRLELATELIKTSANMNMTSIAYNSNFRNVRSFNNAFNKYYHCTPSEYKKIFFPK